MPANLQDKAQVVCPHCGHQQMEPRLAISTNCRQCGRHLLVQELLKPKRKETAKFVEQKRVACFDCGTEIDVAVAAQSAMCKRCSSYIDLQDYTINNAVSKNFKTKGRFVVEAKGYVFNTTIIAREVVLKGRLIGKLTVEQSLTVYSHSELKGTFRTELLTIPPENYFHWKEPLQLGSVDIGGELVSDVHAEKTVTVRSTGRLFGNIRARNLVVEAGALIVGQCAIGHPPVS